MKGITSITNIKSNEIKTGKPKTLITCITCNTLITSGFTLIELMVSMGIFLILFALASLSITRLPSTTAQSTNIDILISDIKSQQTKAMSGNTSGGSAASDYGIYFDTSVTPNKYWLFRGSTYSSGLNKFAVELDPNLSITTTFPGSQIIFTAQSGDVVSYSSTTDSITITNNFINSPTIIRLNKYGATY